MAPKLHHIEIRAPGFLGLNTQDSPTSISPSYASIANNCVIDKFGRVGARKGWSYLTTSGGSALANSDGIELIHHFTSRAGVTTVISAGNDKTFTGTTTLTDDTPGAATITANNWQAVTFNDDVYLFQAGHDPLMWDSSAADTILVSAHGSYVGTVPQGNTVLAAYGRLWVGAVNNDCCTLYWSDLLQGMAWSGGTSGSIDVTKFWPSGDDDIVALAVHNDRLIIFGSKSILIYAGANSPATMVLEDTIENVGCVARDSVVNIGSDIFFLSKSGFRSLSRTIADEGALPFRDISKNVRDDIINDIEAETSNIKALYSQENAFVLLTFPTLNKLYCFDTRRPLEDGSHRTTTWSGINPTAMHRASDGTIYLGEPLGIGQYTGYSDNSVGYVLKYYSPSLDFSNAESDTGDETAQLLKFLKKVGITAVGAQSPTVQIKWAYDFSSNFKSQVVTLDSANYAEYNVSEYNSGVEYSASIIINEPRVNTTGSGTSFTVGIESTITQAEFSLQQINIYATIGRLL